MKISRYVAILFPLVLATAQAPQKPFTDAAAQEAALAAEVKSNPDDAAALFRYAEFLERYGAADSREAYRLLLKAQQRAGDLAGAESTSRRLMRLDSLAGDKATVAAPPERARSMVQWGSVHLPGPLRSFARMAAVSPDNRPVEVLPALARNVFVRGYAASYGNGSLLPTEYLKLVTKYLSQARELQALAGDGQVLHVESCDSPETGALLKVLGYRMRGGCGAEVVLETVNAPRAFLTVDSGFPLNELEQALRTDRPFRYDYHGADLPVLFGPEYWLPPKEPADFMTAFLGDPTMCRLYLALSKLDPETASAIRTATPLARLRAQAHVLDFFGEMFQIRNGRAYAPGGARSAAAWGELAGEPVEKGALFYEKLCARDDGWLAGLFDALARIDGPVQTYLTEPARLKRFYAALRGRVTSPGPARPVFRSNTELMLYTSRIQLGPDGAPHIPGGLEVWKNLFTARPLGKYDARLSRAASSWKDADDLLEALFGLSRKAVENQPLRLFAALTDLDRRRSAPLAPATVSRLMRGYKDYGSQYPLFAESPALSDASMVAYLDAAEAIVRLRDATVEGDAAGCLQGLASLWQILVRQGDIPAAAADAPFGQIAAAFGHVNNERDVFVAASKGLDGILAAATRAREGTRSVRLAELLTSAQRENAEVHEQLWRELSRILEAQRTIPLDTIFALDAQLETIAHGGKPDSAALNKLSAAISEVPLPRPPLTAAERASSSLGTYAYAHVEAQRRLNMRAEVDKAVRNPERVGDVRGLLAPLLRDTLVAYSYAYYAPPGAQALFVNPVLVRSHDFVAASKPLPAWQEADVFSTGWPSSGGGRLSGSLAGLPHALATAEQAFLIPVQTQALIWNDLAPQILVSAKLPRYWSVTPAQMHWTALHLRYGRELLAESASAPETRRATLQALSRLASPARIAALDRELADGDVKTAVESVTPSELFTVARTLAPQRAGENSAVGAELRALAAERPEEVNYAAVSRAFGTPKPTLANSMQPELLNLRTFPTLMGYSSRLLAESWESNTLYWAALADELHLPPAELNIRAPEWTRKLLEQVFASSLDDWPALLKSLHRVGDAERADLAARQADRAAIAASANQ